MTSKTQPEQSPTRARVRLLKTLSVAPNNEEHELIAVDTRSAEMSAEMTAALEKTGSSGSLDVQSSSKFPLKSSPYVRESKSPPSHDTSNDSVEGDTVDSTPLRDNESPCREKPEADDLNQSWDPDRFSEHRDYLDEDSGGKNRGDNAHQNNADEDKNDDDDDDEIGDDERDISKFVHGGRSLTLEQLIDLWQLFRYECGVVVNNSKVQLFIVAMIAVNALMMGIATFDFVKNDPQMHDAFETVDKIFLIVFTIELGMQFTFYGWRMFLDGWLIFDLVIISMSWGFQQVQIIRAFRIFRALRLITRIKTMKNLVVALFGVMPRMVAIGLLLFLVSYIFAVMFTQLFKDLYEDGVTEEDYFGRIDDTFFTLFQIMTLDNWADVARDTMKEYRWAWFPIVIFVIITGFVVVNLIIAVICDAVSALHEDDKARLHGTYEDESSSELHDTDHSSKKASMREQLDNLELFVRDLTIMQAQTLQTMEQLANQISKESDETRYASETTDTFSTSRGLETEE